MKALLRRPQTATCTAIYDCPPTSKPTPLDDILLHRLVHVVSGLVPLRTQTRESLNLASDLMLREGQPLVDPKKWELQILRHCVIHFGECSEHHIKFAWAHNNFVLPVPLPLLLWLTQK